MKTIKTYIQARRHKFSNNRGGFGLLGGGGWLLELLDGGGTTLSSDVSQSPDF